MKIKTNSSSTLAPIVLFVYNRPEHTKRTIEALINNELSESSTLYIFSDAAKNDIDKNRVNDVRRYINNIKGFKDIHIHLQKNNKGLAQSIISGVTEIVEHHGCVIVLEDDLETSPYFLRYMNDALELYMNNEEVMHISGSMYPTDFRTDKSSFFLRVPLCWGWATWKDAWSNFSNDIRIMERFNKQQQAQFNFNNSYTYWKQLELNQSGEINTWFIFWYASLFLKGGLTLFPSSPLVQNIGMDGTGVHCAATRVYNVDISLTPITLEHIPITHSDEAFKFHVKYFESLKPNFKKRFKHMLSVLMGRT